MNNGEPEPFVVEMELRLSLSFRPAGCLDGHEGQDMAGKAAKKAEKASASTAHFYSRIILLIFVAALIKGERSCKLIGCGGTAFYSYIKFEL